MDSISRKTIFKEYTKSSGIYPKEQINRMGRMLNNIQGKDGVRVDTTPYGITIHGPNEKKRFFLYESRDESGNPTVRVYVGKWTRNGTELNLDADSSVLLYKTIPYADFTTDSDNFVYLELDEVESPSEVTLGVATTVPDQSTDDLYWVLGNAYIDSSGIMKITQYWYGGDIDDVSSSSGNVDSDYECSLTESLEKDDCEEGSEGTRHFNRIAGFLSPTTVSNAGDFGTDEDEYTVVVRKAGDGSTTASTVKYYIPVDISVVTGVTYSTSTHKLEMTKSTITVFKHVTDGSNPYLIEQAEECVSE